MKRLAVRTFLSLLFLCPLAVAGGQAHTHGDKAAMGAAQAGPHGPHGPHDPGAFLAQSLGLTDEQKAALEPLHAQLAEDSKPLHADLHQKWQAVQTSLDAGADAATVGQQVIDAYGTMKQLRQAHDRFEAAFTALLTPDQQAKLARFKTAHQNMDGPPGGMGMGFPPLAP